MPRSSITLAWTLLVALGAHAQNRSLLDSLDQALAHTAAGQERVTMLLNAAEWNGGPRPERAWSLAKEAMGLADAGGPAEDLATARELGGIALAQMGDTVRAGRLLDEALDLRMRSKDPKGLFRHWLKRGRARMHLRDRAGTEAAFARAQSLLNAEVRASDRLDLLLALGEAHLRLKALKRALPVLNEALALLDTMEISDRRLARAWMLLGTAHGDIGHANEAVACHERSIWIAYKLRDAYLLALNGTSLGLIMLDKGAQGAATAHLLRAKRYAEELGASRLLPPILDGLAGCYWGVRPAIAVDSLFRRSLALSDSLGMKSTFLGTALTHAKFIASTDSAGCVAIGLAPERKFVHARERVEEALGWARLHGEPYLESKALDALAGVASLRGDHARSLELHHQALRLQQELGEERGIAATLNDIAFNYGIQDDSPATCDSVYKYMHASIDAKRRAGIREGLDWIYLQLHFVARHQSKFEQAMRYMEEAYAVRDTLHKESLAAEQRSYEHSARLEQKQLTDSLEHVNALVRVESQRAIERLRADQNRNRAVALGLGALLLIVGGALYYRIDRRRQRAAYERDVAEISAKALRAQMNPHFIGNAMQSIHRYMDRNDGPKAAELLVSFSGLMRAVLENSAHRQVPLHEDVEVLRSYLEFERSRTNGKFDYTVEVDRSLAAVNAQVPPLVVQPFLENAIRHGLLNKDGHGHLFVKAALRDGALRITVEDDGVGRAAAANQPAEHRSMSTGITRQRLEHLSRQTGKRADFRIIDLPQGTRVEIDLPLSTAA